MAATATQGKDFTVHGGGGCRIETGFITFDNDATVELPTKLRSIAAASFVKVGAGGTTTPPSINETNATNGIQVPASGFITVTTASNNSSTYRYMLMGI